LEAATEPHQPVVQIHPFNEDEFAVRLGSVGRPTNGAGGLVTGHPAEIAMAFKLIGSDTAPLACRPFHLSRWSELAAKFKNDALVETTRRISKG
jgi:hypothetical protein